MEKLKTRIMFKILLEHFPNLLTVIFKIHDIK